MKIAILGSGLQGTACALDLCRSRDVEELALADMDLSKAEAAVKSLSDRIVSQASISARRVEVSKHDELVTFLKPYDVVVSAVPYFYNLGVTRAAIEAGTHMVDMGGNTDLVFEQRALNDAAKAAGVTILPDAGLAPGLANIVAVHGINQLDSVESVRIRVGGLPQFPKPPLNYQLFFSIHGLINEYLGQSVVLRHGKIERVDTLTEVERLTFADPIGELEAFHTLGGISTLPWTYEGRIERMDYKTIRYPGHCSQIKTLADLGLLDETPVQVDGHWVVPRELFAALAIPKLTFEDNRDMVLMRIIIEGQKRGEALRMHYEMVDTFDDATGLTAMTRTTAFPVSIIAQMLGRGVIAERGVLPLETAVPTGTFLSELESRNIRLKVDTVPLSEAHSH